MSTADTVDFQDQSQWADVSLALNWGPSWTGPGNVFSSIIPVANWLGANLHLVNNGTVSYLVIVTWFLDAAGSTPVGSETFTVGSTVNWAFPFVVHKGSYMQIELSAPAGSAAASVAVLHTNRPQPKYSIPDPGLIFNKQGISVPNSGTNTYAATMLYGGPAHFWGQMTPALSTLSVAIQSLDFNGNITYVEDVAGTDQSPAGNFGKDIVVPPGFLRLQLINGDAGAAHTFYAVLCPRLV